MRYFCSGFVEICKNYWDLNFYPKFLCFCNCLDICSISLSRFFRSEWCLCLFVFSYQSKSNWAPVFLEFAISAYSMYCFYLLCLKSVLIYKNILNLLFDFDFLWLRYWVFLNLFFGFYLASLCFAKDLILNNFIDLILSILNPKHLLDFHYQFNHFN